MDVAFDAPFFVNRARRATSPRFLIFKLKGVGVNSYVLSAAKSALLDQGTESIFGVCNRTPLFPSLTPFFSYWDKNKKPHHFEFPHLPIFRHSYVGPLVISRLRMPSPSVSTFTEHDWEPKNLMSSLQIEFC